MRKYLTGLLVVLPIAALVFFFADNDRDLSVARPNIVLIIADDLGPQIGVYGDPNAQTPHIDRLANDGVRFDRGYVTTASCSPSRGSIMTGLYPHQHGMMGLSHFGTERMHDDVPKLPNELKKLGYRTAIVGKVHSEPQNQFAWDLREVNAGVTMFDRDVLEMNRRAMDFVDSVPANKPFLLVMSYVDPHRGHADDGNTYGPGRNIRFPRVKKGLPATPTPASDIEPFPFLGLDSPEIRRELADFYGAVDRLDIGIGDLRKQLEARGAWDEALVIFVGDHGPDVTRGKMAVYESATRVPYLLKMPGSNAGSVRRELVSTIDLLPTLLDAAGAPAETHQGRSLIPLIEGDVSRPWRQYLFTEYVTHVPGQFYPRYSVRDDRFKLILNLLGGERPSPLTPANYCSAWFESQKPQYRQDPIREVYKRVAQPPRLELYDLHNDPHEWRNLAEDPKLHAVRDRLLAAIQAWRKQTDDPMLQPEQLKRQALKELKYRAGQK